jgi:signal transduction histidine kinase
MENKSKTKNSSTFQINRKYWLPYFIVIIGIIITLFTWYGLINDYSAHFFATSFAVAVPWIVLVVGIAVSILAAIAFQLAQVTQERTTSLSQVRADFKNESVERVKAEESRQKLEIALLQSQKLQAIGTLAGGIAHDFNNILYAIIGYVEMAREDVDKETLVYQNLGKVLSAAARGKDLVSRILAFGRRHQHEEFKPLNAQSIIEDALSLLRPTVPASVMIEFITTNDEMIILGDQTQLHQVIVNIINNAVDAMEGEGTITIQLRYLKAGNRYLNQFQNIAHLDYCKIDITDTGQGMDQLTMERIFEPFYTTKEVGKGTGLGLATAHGIIKEHQGEIIVTSKLKKGTTFSLLLPLAPLNKE